MKYTRLYADADGETHFEDVEEESQQVELAPTAVFGVTKNRPASNVFLTNLPPGYIDDFHSSPVRYLVAFLQGEIDQTVSDGEVRRFRPGDVVLADDMVSRGRKSVVVGQKNVELMLVELAE